MVDDTLHAQFDNNSFFTVIVNGMSGETAFHIVIWTVPVQQCIFHLPVDHSGTMFWSGNIFFEYYFSKEREKNMKSFHNPQFLWFNFYFYAFAISINLHLVKTLRTQCVTLSPITMFWYVVTFFWVCAIFHVKKQNCMIFDMLHKKDMDTDDSLRIKKTSLQILVFTNAICSHEIFRWFSDFKTKKKLRINDCEFSTFEVLFLNS